MRIAILSVFLFAFVARAESVVPAVQPPVINVNDPSTWAQTGAPSEDQIALNEKPNNLNELNEALRAQARRDYAAQLNQFMEKVRNKVQDHANDTKEVQFGKFKITIQNSCDLGIDPYKPPAAPTHMEKDCVKGQVNASAMAQLVMEAVAKNPPSPEQLEASISECKIEVAWVKNFKIYENCFDGDLPEQYSKLYDAFVSNITKDRGNWKNTTIGWKTNDAGERTMEFKKIGEKTTIDLENFKSFKRDTGNIVSETNAQVDPQPIHLARQTVQPVVSEVSPQVDTQQEIAVQPAVQPATSTGSLSTEVDHEMTALLSGSP